MAAVEEELTQIQIREGWSRGRRQLPCSHKRIYRCFLKSRSRIWVFMDEIRSTDPWCQHWRRLLFHATPSLTLSVLQVQAFLIRL
ncbi:hypothetical protein PIB30_030330 [Stylosanthes scabra]|uniref:Uncharacterized protein n=1 Tax=Stylosanthes scabra TaxID=79078 RepID=A0ABU6TB92_9FABA|nr:hypothetical protein [Stylosanthes scabra]